MYSLLRYILDKTFNKSVHRCDDSPLRGVAGFWSVGGPTAEVADESPLQGQIIS